MKKLLLIFASVLPSISFANCPALDYQELKDMSVPALTEEFCSYTAKAKGYLEEAGREHRYAAELRKINEGYFEMQRSRDAGDAENKGLKLDESAAQCQSQRERILRVLSQQASPSPVCK